MIHGRASQAFTGIGMTNHQQSEVGWQLIHAQKHAEAIAQFRDVLSRDPNYAAALHGLGYVELSAGRRTAAEELLRRATELEPNRAVAHFHLAILLGGKGETSK